MNLLRRSLLLICAASTAGTAFTVATPSARAAAPNEVVGKWLIENPAENHELQGVKSLSINADGSAIKSYGSSSFTKRWSLSRGNLVIVDAPGVTPGPPEEFLVNFADPAKKQLRLKSASSPRAKEIRLSKAGSA